MNFSIPLRSGSTATPIPSLVSKQRDDSILPPGMRRVKSSCKACGKSLGIKYPDAVTYWKIQCPACAQAITIELVGGRKCLVFNVQGRKTVERIGLTDQRRRFYRARCFSCDETLIVPETESGRIKSCHKCGLEYAVREDGEMYYETSVRINEVVTTYREKVQESTGYVANKNRTFFLDEESHSKERNKGGGQQSELNAALAALQREADFLREKEEGLRNEYRQAVADKELLGRKLAKEMEKGGVLEKKVREFAEFDGQLVKVRTQLQKMTQERDLFREERDLLKNKMQVHGEALRALDEAMTKSLRLEAKILTLEESVKRGVEERKLLERDKLVYKESALQADGRLKRGSDALRQAVEERKAMETKLMELKEAAGRLEERLLKSEQNSAMALQGKVRALELENGKLVAQVAEGRRAIKRLQEVEMEVERLRHAGGVTEPESASEDWYCEEGEDSCIRVDSEVGMARKILGIRGQPTPERIKMALRRRVKRYHPDMVSSLGLDLRDLAHRKMQDINRAYTILMKEYGRV